MAKQRVDIVVAAKDQASRKMLGIAKAAIGMGAAFLGWRALKGAVADVVQAYGVQEQAERKLQQVLKATGGAAGFSFDQLKAYAASLQLVTDYGDEATIEMMSLLATFKNVQGPAFTEATGLVLDMSKAMGQDLKSTAIQVGKALNDPILGVTALRRVGVQLSEQQTQQIKQFMANNDVMSAQQIILAELTSQFGGQAAAAAETFSGKLKSLANDWGDAKEQMGGLIASIPGMGKGIDLLRTVFRNFGLSMDIVWTSAALGMVQFWENLKFTFAERIPALAMWLVDNWKNIFTTLWSFTKSLFTGMFENAKNFFSAVWSWLKGDGFDFKWTGLLEGFESTLTELPDLVRRNKSAVETALEDELSGLKSQFAQKLQDVISPTLEVPVAGLPGGPQGAQDPAAAAKASKGVAAVEARFLAGSGRQVDYQKELAGHGRRQVTLMETMVRHLERLAAQEGPRPAAPRATQFA